MFVFAVAGVELLGKQQYDLAGEDAAEAPSRATRRDAGTLPAVCGGDLARPP